MAFDQPVIATSAGSCRRVSAVDPLYASEGALGFKS